MVVVMKRNAPDQDIDAVTDRLKSEGFQVHISRGGSLSGSLPGRTTLIRARDFSRMLAICG